MTSTYPRFEGDTTPRFVQDLATRLSEHGPVTVLAPDAPGARARERVRGVDVVRFRYFVPRRAQRLAYGGGMPANLRSSGLAWLQIPPFMVSEIAAIRRQVATGGCRWVNAHWMVPQGLAAVLARPGVPRFGLLVHVHSSDLNLLRRIPFGATLARFVHARSDAVFTASRFVRENLDALLGYPSGAEVVPMGVDLELFRREAAKGDVVEGFREGFLLFVGRFVAVKGVDVLLQAFAELRGLRPGLGLVLIGSGPEEERLRGEAARLGLGDSARFVGARQHEEIARYLRACRAAVVPSRVIGVETEGMPAVVLEALAAGAKLVASRVGGIPDVVRSGRNGWLSEPGDAADLAAKLAAALDDTRPEIPAAARATAEEHGWGSVCERYRRTLARMGDRQ